MKNNVLKILGLLAPSSELKRKISKGSKLTPDEWDIVRQNATNRIERVKNKLPESLKNSSVINDLISGKVRKETIDELLALIEPHIPGFRSKFDEKMKSQPEIVLGGNLDVFYEGQKMMAFGVVTLVLSLILDVYGFQDIVYLIQNGGQGMFIGILQLIVYTLTISVCAYLIWVGYHLNDIKGNVEQLGHEIVNVFSQADRELAQQFAQEQTSAPIVPKQQVGKSGGDFGVKDRDNMSYLLSIIIVGLLICIILLILMWSIKELSRHKLAQKIYRYV